ncbi:MAG TPA: flagellar biosynthesis protein FlhA, partial [Pirellulales bacterium]|nr:flagellar biosynthesis protein FlhA [Pirellulales bacterium]
NVSTTRLILLDGDAGRIVSTFGGYVVGGNLVVGLVIFLILVIIQFVVITKGSSRVSEVAARFTLDAMPGKQMAIDAELNAGTIDEVVARELRKELAREAEFYGAMDGSSKFVRGDAIAGLIITAINLVGGVILGVTNGLGVMEAVRRFSILTVGDGLISQIPALIVATTAGILVTKASSQVSLGHEIGTQLLANRRPLWVGGAILALISLTPGLPKIPFLAIAGTLFLLLRGLERKSKDPQPAEPRETSKAEARQDQHLREFLQTDRACVEIGAAIIPLVESKRGKGLADRIAGLRNELTRNSGLWVPSIRIRDNVQLEPNAYRILICGREVARAELRPDFLLAIDPGNTTLRLDGEEAKDPAFGLAAKWISPNNRQRAEIAGFTVVDATSVLITHLGEVLKKYAHELLGREDLQTLLDRLKETSPAVLGDIKPEVLRVGTLHQILVLLLEEHVPITNLTRILETLAIHAHQIKSPIELAERVREGLGPAICDRFRSENDRVRVIVMDPRLEMMLRDALHENVLSLPPAALERLIGLLSDEWQKSSLEGPPAALLTDGSLRRPTRHAIARALPDLAVIAYNEIPVDMMIEPVAILSADSISKAANVKDPVENRGLRSVLPTSQPIGAAA